MNSLKHGLRSETVPLPNEDPDAIAARARAWDEYYQPESPAAHHLLNQCVRATLLADRCQRQHDSVVADQLDEALRRWETERRQQVRALAKQFRPDPAAAVAGLERSAHGCRWLIERWETLARALEQGGCWTDDECDDVVRLLGRRPNSPLHEPEPTAYVVELYNLRSQPVPREDRIDAMTAPERRPAELRGRDRAEWLFEPSACRELLEATVAEMLETLRATEERLRTEVDATERARGLDRVCVLQDEATARRFFRYHAESRSTFHRAFKELVGTLERDASAGPFEAGADAPEIGVAKSPPISPNEPKLTPEPDKSSQVVSEPSPSFAGVAGPQGTGSSVEERGAVAAQPGMQPRAVAPNATRKPEPSFATCTDSIASVEERRAAAGRDAGTHPGTWAVGAAVPGRDGAPPFARSSGG